MRISYVFIVVTCLSALQFVHGQTTGPATFEASNVYRDQQFAPHVFADTARAAFYGFGRIQMKDMPTSVAYNFALGAGKLSSIFGVGSPINGGRNLHIHLDTQALQWRLRQKGMLQASTLPNDVRQMILAYTAGVNASRLEWLQNLPALVNNTEPYAFDLPTLTRLLSRPITFQDVMTYGAFFVEQEPIASNDTLAYADDPNASEDHLRTASNSYAIGPAASATEKSMLLSDPHLPFQKFTVLRTYFCQIQGGSYSVCGMSIPAFPCIGAGFNSDFGWALTSNNPDYYDVWKTKTTVSGTSFLLDGNPIPILKVQETIDVYDFATNMVKPRSVTLKYAGDLDTPIIREESTALTTPNAGPTEIWYARSAMNSDKSAWEFLIRLGQARSVADAADVLKMNLGGGNYLMADSSGDLGYLYSGRVPIRKSPTPGTTWAQVQDGGNSAYGWQGIHPVQDLPRERLINSGPTTYVEQKWLQCNSAADLVRPNTKMDLNKYPDYMVHQLTTPESWRQRHGRKLLNAQERFTGAELRGLATDIQDIWYDAIAHLIDGVVQEYALEQYPEVLQMMTKLRQWDRVADIHNTEPVYTHMIYAYFVEAQRKYQSRTVGGHYEVFHYPEEIPDWESWWQQDWDIVRSNLAAAVIRSANTYGELLNPLLPGVTFPTSPWTPNPWGSFSTQVPEWGTAHYVTLTPYTSPSDQALYPAGGTISQFTLGSELLPFIEDTIVENAGILGQYGPLLSYPLDSGAHTVFQVTFGDDVEAWYLEALGPSELADDPKRYVNAANFANRVFVPFPCDFPTVSSLATQVFNWNLDTSIFLP